MLLFLIILSLVPTPITAQNLSQYTWQTIDKISDNELAVIEQASGKPAQKFVSTAVAFKTSGGTVLLFSRDGTLQVFNCGFEYKEIYSIESIEYALKELEKEMISFVDSEKKDKADKVAEKICNIIKVLPSIVVENRWETRNAFGYLARRGNKYRTLWEPLLYSKFSFNSVSGTEIIVSVFRDYLGSLRADPFDVPTIQEIKAVISFMLQKLTPDSARSLVSYSLLEWVRPLDPAYAKFLEDLFYGFTVN
ncbi:MAG: hypothetical protein HYT63_02925 [Candidatus Yanofskybacteria bacterium]|nr:hypothetical protein [Candidatus Yanofskybacteria bacterium]